MSLYPALASARRTRFALTITRVRAAYRVAPLLSMVPFAALLFWTLGVRHFDGLFGQDPYAYFDYSVGPMRRFLQSGALLPSFYWPLGYPLAAGLAALLLGGSHLATQAVSLTTGAACVLLTYLLAMEALRARCVPRPERSAAAALAALTFGAGGYLVESSVVAMADSAALAATLLSAVALLRAGRAENDRSAYLWTGLCGAALAYAVVTRWGQAWLAPVWLVAAVGATPRRPANPGRRLLAASIAALAILLPQLWLAAVTPRGAVRPRAFMGDFGGAGSTWQLRHLLERTFTNSDGTFHYALPNLLYYASGPFRSMYLTPLILPALVLGALQLRRLEASAVALLTLWPGTLLLVDGGLAWQDPRFILMAVPPLAIVSGFGFAVALARWPAWRGILLLLIAVTTLAIAGGAARGLDRLIASSRADLQVAAWTHDRLPSQYTLLSFEITETLQHHGVEARELSALAPAQLDRLVSRQSDVFLLVRPSTVTGQAQFLNPGRDFVTLSATKRLRAVGTLDGYTLYRVKRR